MSGCVTLCQGVLNSLSAKCRQKLPTKKAVAPSVGKTEGKDPTGQEAIAEVMGISQQRVGQILSKIQGASNFASDKNKVKEAIRLYLQGLSHRSIAESFGVSHPTISSVVREYIKRKDLITGVMGISFKA